LAQGLDGSLQGRDRPPRDSPPCPAGWAPVRRRAHGMPGSADYYVTLGVPRSANDAEIRKAYREQALLHHPDKNPDRAEEATRQFKLVAEAYSVLKDPQKRAAYDAGGLSSAGCPGQTPRDANINIEKARDLFREVFGAEFADALATTVAPIAARAGQLAAGAAPHVRAAAVATALVSARGLSKAAEAAGSSAAVRGGVGAMLRWGTQEATATVTEMEERVALCQLRVREEQFALASHKDAVKQVHAERELEASRRSWWQSAKDLATGSRRDREEREDEALHQLSKKLGKRVRQAKAEHEAAQRELEFAMRAQSQARHEEEEVQRDGVSLRHVVNAGSHLFSRAVSFGSLPRDEGHQLLT